jgi:hypothetical protein
MHSLEVAAPQGAAPLVYIRIRTRTYIQACMYVQTTYVHLCGSSLAPSCTYIHTYICMHIVRTCSRYRLGTVPCGTLAGVTN